MAEAGALASSCDVAEELSRQLEDILSTYCQQDASSHSSSSVVEDAALLPNGQSDGLEHGDLLADGKSEEVKVNGGGSGSGGGGGGGGEKEQKKIMQQDKKKVKGLGELCYVHTRDAPDPDF